MVTPKSQGKGYGTKLLNFIVAKIKQTHRMPIVLTVAACNNNAVKMYEKFGFVPVSEETDKCEIEGDTFGESFNNNY